MYIIRFLLLLILIGFALAMFALWRVWRRIKDTVSRFGNGMDKEGGGGGHVRKTTTEGGDTIIDNRNPEEVDKKIFAKDEGEYVDFKEK